MTGNAEIDRDHEVLVRTVNELSSAMIHSRGREVIGGVLERPTDDTAQHFAREARIWPAGGLSSLAAHRAAHQALLRKVGAFAEDFRYGRGDLPVEMMSLLCEWLVDHVFKSDKAAVAALASKT